MSVARTPAPQGVTKHDLIQWAAKRRELDLVSKTILKSLAYFAMDDGDTWATVETLADEANCSVRTVQYRLRSLSEGGYLADTGRTWRLKRSTRSVPIYNLGPTIEALREDAGEPVSMGANPAPIEGAWVQNPGGMGATACTPKDHLGSPDKQKGACASGLDEGVSLGEAYARIEAAYPPSALAATNPEAARAALADRLGEGVLLADLIAAASELRARPKRKNDFGVVSLQRWLGEGRFRGFGPFLARAESGASAAGVGGAGEAWAGPVGLWAAVVEAKGERLGRVLLAERTRVEGARVICATPAAYRELSQLAGIFEQHGCELVAPDAANAGGSK